MKSVWLSISLIDVSILPSQWWVSILDVSYGDYQGALFEIGRNDDRWYFDMFYLAWFFKEECI